MLEEMIRFLFWVFLIYTWLYALQWIIGLCVSVYSMANVEKSRRETRELVSDAVASENKVSVIIAAFNEEDCIVGTIESLLNEDYPNLEIIVVDDGSKDNMAAKIINKYALKQGWCFEGKEKPCACEAFERETKSGRLVLLRKENGGKAKALNLGLALCSGKYSLVLDADTKVERGSIRAMVARFLRDPQTLVCAGAVGNDETIYREVSFWQKCLLMFQMLEYYRTFYLQRIFLDKLNANIVVSGAFALFDCEFIKAMGGYQENTIGEDMELTMRLHAFCQSQKRTYKIAYTEEARCTTQFPFRYRDFFRQRRRWQIGMLQSLWRHRYMLANVHYGIVGTFTCSIFILYELLAPFIEIVGFGLLVGAFYLRILSVPYTIFLMGIYYFLMIFMEMVIIISIDTYGIERIRPRKVLALFGVGVVEFATFHILNSVTKMIAIISRKKHGKTWQHISRANE